jgi:predicted RNase H-like nuclease (RuvC/YqgF family)
MAKRRLLVAITAVVLGGLTASGAAFAGESQREPGERPGRDHRAFCERLESKMQHLRAAIGRLEELADKIERKIESGTLTPEQEARARKALAKVNEAIDRLQQQLRHLMEVYEERCD